MPYLIPRFETSQGSAAFGRFSLRPGAGLPQVGQIRALARGIAVVRRPHDAAGDSVLVHLTKFRVSRVSYAMRVRGRSCPGSTCARTMRPQGHAISDGKEEKLGSQSTDLLLGLLQITMLLAILFRLSSMFTLIATTQRELRRAIYYQGERHVPELNSDIFGERPVSPQAFNHTLSQVCSR